MSDKEVMTVPEMAEYLSVSEAHTYRLVREHRVPFVRIGRSVRFKRSEVDQWLADKTLRAVK